MCSRNSSGRASGSAFTWPSVRAAEAGDLYPPAPDPCRPGERGAPHRRGRPTVVTGHPLLDNPLGAG